MKVVHVVEAWKGGIASYVEALIDCQISQGHTVVLIADSAQLKADDRILGAEVITYKSSRNPLRCLQISSWLSHVIKRIQPDVVHCHSTFPGVYVRLNSYSCKVIYTPHGWSFFKQDVGVGAKFLYKAVERFLSRRCSRIICMSLEEMKAAREIGISAQTLTLAYTGIPDGVVSDSNPTNTIGSNLKIGFFGRFDYQKGFDLVEKVAPLLNKNIEVHVFGGAVRGAPRSVSSHLICHGWINHSEIHEYMLGMDAILIPSRWEGFALTPLEAMRAGRPVVISNLSSLPEVVVHGFNGLILPDYKESDLACILNSLTKEECRRMGGNARIVYEQGFTFDRFSKVLDAIYRE